MEITITILKVVLLVAEVYTLREPIMLSLKGVSSKRLRANQ
jgi:hypothetical protein